jgi:hypothetical protein
VTSIAFASTTVVPLRRASPGHKRSGVVLGRRGTRVGEGGDAMPGEERGVVEVLLLQRTGGLGMVEYLFEVSAISDHPFGPMPRKVA